MGCGCGKKTAAVTSSEINTAMAASAAQRYEVVYPDGSRQTFDAYLDAAVARAQVPGATVAGAA